MLFKSEKECYIWDHAVLGKLRIKSLNLQNVKHWRFPKENTQKNLSDNKSGHCKIAFANTTCGVCQMFEVMKLYYSAVLQ